MLAEEGRYEKSEDELRQGELQRPRAVLPVHEVEGVGEIGEDELTCAPCIDEEEQAATPGLLPSVYQPTRSEFIDHCESFPLPYTVSTLRGRQRSRVWA